MSIFEEYGAFNSYQNLMAIRDYSDAQASAAVALFDRRKITAGLLI